MKVSVRWRVCFEGEPPSLPRKYLNFFSHFIKEIPNNRNLFLEISYMRKFLSGLSKKKLTYQEIAPLISSCPEPSRSLFEDSGKEVFDYCHRDVQLYILAKMGITTSDLHKLFSGAMDNSS